MPFPELKSAEQISVEDAEKLIAERAEKMCKSVSPVAACQTSCHRSDDGKLVVSKAVSSAVVRAVTADGVEGLAKQRGIDWKPEYAGRAVDYWASDERVDRHGDIVRQFWDFENFRANPLVLYSHDWGLPPIGNSLVEEVVQRDVRRNDGTVVYSGPSLRILALFALGWDWAETIFNLVSGGFLKAGSVGMYPKAILRIQDPEERNRLGINEWGLVYGTPDLPNELIEWTVASVPANPGALQMSLRALATQKKIGPSSVQVVRDLARRDVARGRGDTKAWQRRDEELITLWKSVFPGMRAPKHVAIDEPVILQEADVDGEPKGATAEDLSALRTEISMKMASIESAVEDVRAMLDEAKAAREAEAVRRSAENETKTSAILSELLEASRRAVASTKSPA